MIKVALGLDIADFQSKLTKAVAGIKGAFSSGSFAGIATQFAALGVTAAGVGAVVSGAALGMYKAMSQAGELVDLEERTGVALESLMALRLGFEQAGLAADEVGPTINKLQKQIADAAQGNATAAGTFAQLGVSLSDLVKMSPDQQLEAVGEAIKKIENPALKAQLAMDVFGKSGGKLLALFAAGGLGEAGQFIGKQAQLMAQNAGIFDAITDSLGAAAIKLQGFFVGMASEVAPELLGALEEFNQLDLSGIGEIVGRVVAILIRGVDLFVGTLKFGMQFIVSSLAMLFTLISNALVEGFKAVTSMDFWSGLLTLLVGIAQKFGATLLGVIPGMGKKAAEMQARSEENIAAGSKSADVENRLMRIGESDILSGAAETGLQSFSDFGQKISDVFGTSFEERAQTAREKFPRQPKQTETDLAVAPKVKTAGEGIVSSLAKIGGAVGGVTGGADPQLDQLRQQTTALQSMLGKLDQLIAVGQSDNASGGAMVLA